MVFDMPNSLIGEVTLIGTGGGYGESVVIHMGNSNWVVIDSCINPKTKVSLPLWYLEKIGVNVATDVKTIVCTHWHDDHIRGLSQLLEKCVKAKFCIADVTDRKKFLRFVSLDYQKLTDATISDSSTVEFNACLELSLKSANGIVRAKENLIVETFKLTDNLNSKLFSLSPSEHTIGQFHHELSTLMDTYAPARVRVPINSPNAKSIAAYVKLGHHNALLGSDLEVSLDDKQGWINILDNHKVIENGSSLFKISHHGSENGYHKRIFEELLHPKPITTLTPWNKKEKLPRAEMLKTYIDHSSEVYITSAIALAKKGKKRNNEVDKLISKFKVKLEEVKFDLGIIRSRINMNDIDAKWITELSDSAFKVN